MKAQENSRGHVVKAVTASRRLCRAIAAAALSLPLLLGGTPASTAPLSVAILTSDESAPYTELIDAVRKELAREGAGKAEIVVLPWQAVSSIPTLKSAPELLVAVGVKAAQALASSGVRIPVLNTLIPSDAFEKIARQYGRMQDARNFSAVYLDQPFSRQFGLIRTALPGRTRVGVLLGPDSAEHYPSLQTAAKEQKLDLQVERIATERELIPAVQRVLEESGVLLAIPDPLVFNGSTIQNLLLTSYRYQRPVVGFSAAYMRAGALVAVYSTPAQLGIQVAEILQRASLAGTTQLPSPQYPKYYSISVNRHVARSLGLHVPDESRLLEGLRRLESEP